MEGEASRTGRDVRFTGWLEPEQAIRWLAHADVLIFPSRGPESLSRVLIEASALGVAVAAMRTGGTTDIIEHERTGLLSTSPAELAGDVRRLIADPALRQRLGSSARQRAAERFDTPRVVPQVDDLYKRLVAEKRR
jgi:spore coat protein SA